MTKKCSKERERTNFNFQVSVTKVYYEFDENKQQQKIK